MDDLPAHDLALRDHGDAQWSRHSTRPHAIVKADTGEQGPIQFSMLANSGSLDHDANLEERVAGRDALLDAAERDFGREELYARKLYAYECVKTESLSTEEEKRRYSYWIEHPRDTNCLSVLPRKFSFFPTVAYQTYRRIKNLLHLDEEVSRKPFHAGSKSEHLAQALVAAPYPLQLLTAEPNLLAATSLIPVRSEVEPLKPGLRAGGREGRRPRAAPARWRSA